LPFPIAPFLRVSVLEAADIALMPQPRGSQRPTTALQAAESPAPSRSASATTQHRSGHLTKPLANQTAALDLPGPDLRCYRAPRCPPIAAVSPHAAIEMTDLAGPGPQAMQRRPHRFQNLSPGRVLFSWATLQPPRPLAQEHLRSEYPRTASGYQRSHGTEWFLTRQNSWNPALSREKLPAQGERKAPERKQSRRH
jgi:hypothetical protein